ncbi:MAG: hypothetical protein PWQ59_2280 [Thermoanaerobacterium sp.]|jgi:hypothetical protein|nr:hypothetical protein [Thermoanaerobacterium sp.]
MATRNNFSKKKQAIQQGNYQNLDKPESHHVSKKAEIKNILEWEKQIWFWRSHLDIFIEEYFSTPEKPINLFPFQKVVTRACGNCNEVIDVEARSLGKTFKIALIATGLAILYPFNRILVVSKTARQAILTVKYIEQLANSSSNIAREIIFPIRIQKDEAVVKFKSGSVIEALPAGTDMDSLRGKRAKVIIIDESLLIKSEPIQKVLYPIIQYKRDIYWKYKDQGFEDFDSKIIQISSAYIKSCDFYTRFKNAINEMKQGNKKVFACALSYKTGIRYGIIDENFVESQKKTMPLSSWEMEWNARFIGATEGSYFPYDLTEPCRNLEHVEISQPKGSKSRYILSLDVATSTAKTADNACLCVVKISEKTDGTFIKYLVYMRSYHGYKLESLSQEVRKTCVRFPNIEKVIIDINALGEGIISLLNTPYVDEDNKEHPPFVLDDLENYNNSNVLPIIRGIKPDNKINKRMATATRMYLENKSLHIPVPSANVRRDNSENISSKKKSVRKEEIAKQMLLEEFSIYLEADALQFEMGNIVPKITASGNVTYDTLTQTQHKDRYSALAMAMEYIFTLEEENKKNMINSSSNECLGLAFNW